MIETERLILRRWIESDIDAHHVMCSDPAFMRYLAPGPIPRCESIAAAQRQNAYADSYGSCFWAVEQRSTGRFIGYCGIKPGAGGTPIEGQPEIGWGIARDASGQGYAREAAQACLARAWAQTDWPLVAAITVPANTASWGLMERLGMGRDPAGDFDHPSEALDSPLRHHITYRIARP